jgi:hypothetical protein
MPGQGRVSAFDRVARWYIFKPKIPIWVCVFRRALSIEILDLEDACWKKVAIFFQLVSTLFCEVKRGYVDRRKIVPLKQITLSRVEISQFFTRCYFPQNICKTCANILVLDLRFLWPCQSAQENTILKYLDPSYNINLTIWQGFWGAFVFSLS